MKSFTNLVKNELIKMFAQTAYRVRFSANSNPPQVVIILPPGFKNDFSLA